MRKIKAEATERLRSFVNLKVFRSVIELFKSFEQAQNIYQIDKKLGYNYVALVKFITYYSIIF